MKLTKISTACFILILSITTSCKKEADPDPNKYFYTIPSVYTDGLETASLESVGMDVLTMGEMMNYIHVTEGHTIHNILIIKNNKLVFEEYFKGYKLLWSAAEMNGELMDYTKDTDHFMASVSKSVTSVVVGIAVKEGLISDINNKIIDYFPEYSGILTGEKANITVQHLLTMTCGLELDESTYSYNDPRNELRQVITMEDPIAYILSKPLQSTPGTHFSYSSGTGIVLSAIIEKVSDMKFLDYSNSRLFDPLRSAGGAWSSIHNGLTFASGGLYFKARELSKIGLLFLNNGQWEEQEIITPEWIELSQQAHIPTNNVFFQNSGYGYQWWNTQFVVNGVSQKCFFAAGWSDQFMFIIPGLDMIIEFNSGNYYGSSEISPFDLLERYIFKAIK